MSQNDEASFSPAEESSKVVEYISQLKLRVEIWKKECAKKAKNTLRSNLS